MFQGLEIQSLIRYGVRKLACAFIRTSGISARWAYGLMRYSYSSLITRHLLLVLCLTSCFLLACGSDPEEDQVLTPEENLRIGWGEYSSGNYEAAIQVFVRVVAG